MSSLNIEKLRLLRVLSSSNEGRSEAGATVNISTVPLGNLQEQQRQPVQPTGTGNMQQYQAPAQAQQPQSQASFQPAQPQASLSQKQKRLQLANLQLQQRIQQLQEQQQLLQTQLQRQVQQQQKQQQQQEEADSQLDQEQLRQQEEAQAQARASSAHQQQAAPQLDVRKLLFQLLDNIGNAQGQQPTPQPEQQLHQHPQPSSAAGDTSNLLARASTDSLLQALPSALLQASNAQASAAAKPASQAPAPTPALRDVTVLKMLSVLLGQTPNGTNQTTSGATAVGPGRLSMPGQAVSPTPMVISSFKPVAVRTVASPQSPSKLVDLLLNQRPTSAKSPSQLLFTSTASAAGQTTLQQIIAPQNVVAGTAGNVMGNFRGLELASWACPNLGGTASGMTTNGANLKAPPASLSSSSPTGRALSEVSDGGNSSGGVPLISSSSSDSNSVSNSSRSRAPSAASAPEPCRSDAEGLDPACTLSDIEYPGQNDCMFGRGGGTSNHIGNINFRLLVEKYKKRYAEASKLDKPRVAELVVRQWRARSPPGRFLTRTNPDEGSMSKWHDVGDKRARRKCAQALREKHGRCRDESCNVEPPPINDPVTKRPRFT